MSVNLSNWTPFLFVNPRRFVSNAVGADFDLWTWSVEEYTWEQDGYNGWLDITQPVVKTVSTDRGDCEDYALVAASVEAARSDEARAPHHVSIVFCFPQWSPIPRHVVCYADGPEYTRVYSSGEIYDDTTLDEYIETSPYAWYIVRQI